MDELVKELVLGLLKQPLILILFILGIVYIVLDLFPKKRNKKKKYNKTLKNN